MIVIVKKYGIWNGSCTMSVKNAFFICFKKIYKSIFLPTQKQWRTIIGFHFWRGWHFDHFDKKIGMIRIISASKFSPKDLVVLLGSVVEKFFHCLTKSHFQTKCSLTHQSFKFHWISQSMIAVTVDFTAWHPPPCD